MNTPYLIWSVVFVLLNCLISFSAIAQIHVDENLHVGVGTNDIPDAKMRVVAEETDLQTGVEIISKRELGDVDNVRYGLHNLMENGDNFRKTGFFNETIHNNTGSSFRILMGQENKTTSQGRGAIIGIQNTVEGSVNNGTHHVTGIFSKVSKGGNAAPLTAYKGFVEAASLSNCVGASMEVRDTEVTDAGFLAGYLSTMVKTQMNDQKVYGTYNTISSKGNGDKFGTYNTLSHSDVATSNMHYGTYNQHRLGPGGSPHVYGSYNDITFYNNNTTFAGEQYGVFGNINEVLNSPLAYAIYGSAPTTNTNSLAGYFDGNVKVTGTVMQMSDERLKTNISVLTNATEIISQLQPKTYEFNTLGNSDINLPAGTQFGFIAQELELIVPELVADVTHGGNMEYIEKEVQEYEDRFDTDGNLIEPELVTRIVTETEIIPATESYKSINYTALIPILVQGMKEQQARIEELERLVEILINE